MIITSDVADMFHESEQDKLGPTYGGEGRVMSWPLAFFTTGLVECVLWYRYCYDPAETAYPNWTFTL